MSLSWTFLTKSFMPLRYRDMIAVIIIGKYSFTKYTNYFAEESDSNFIMGRMYTHDESDIGFQETHNMTDGHVRRTKMLAFANQIK